MAWVRPSRSRPTRPKPRPGQEGDVDGNSGGAGGSSLPGGDPEALGGGGTGLGRRRGARAPRDQCHQPDQIDKDPSCRRGFRPLLLAPPWKSRNVVLLGASPANQCLQRAPKKLLVALGPGADDIDEQVSPGHGGGEVGGRINSVVRQQRKMDWDIKRIR